MWRLWKEQQCHDDKEKILGKGYFFFFPEEE